MDYPNINSLWNYSDPKSSEERFSTLLETVDKASHPLYYAETLTQLARSRALQRKFDEAHMTLDEAETMIGTEKRKERVRYLLERGRVFNSSKKSGAIPLFEDAYNMAKEIGEDYYAVDAAHMLGIAEEPEKSLQWNLKAIQVAEQSALPEPKGWLGALYNNIGWTYFSKEEYSTALPYFEKDKVWYAERKRRREELIAEWSIAKTKRKLGQIEEALQRQLVLSDTYIKESIDEDGFNAEEIAECLYELGRIEEARPYFKRAYELLSKDMWLPHDDPQRLQRLADLGESSDNSQNT